MKILAKTACFGGQHLVISHDSKATGTPMELSLFIPPAGLKSKQALPWLIYLSGLTCTWENAATKAGAQYHAAKAGLVLVFPDTSPRSTEEIDVADDEAFSLGQGAGYYMTATQKPWADHYQMESYITDELAEIVAAHVEIDRDRCGLTGHSMGGHGALTLAMKNPNQFKSVSAFAPISALSESPWGKIALDAYRGGADSELYDAAKLMLSHGWDGDILVDQGADDPFKNEHLLPDRLVEAAIEAGIDLSLRIQSGYDHSYWFVASFIEDHIDWHKVRLGRD